MGGIIASGSAAADVASADAASLHASWARAWAGAGCAGEGGAVRDALLAAHREPARRYHTLQHLGECLARFEATRHLAARPAEVEIALWFHDAVYDVRGAGNEERSAAWAEVALREGGAAPEVAGRVHALVMATRHTAIPADPDEQLLVDIDLAILGAGEARFDEYERQIRDEYGHVPEALFNEKRRAILESFARRPRLFATAALCAELEDRARTNLARAVAAIDLGSGSPP